MDKYVALIPLRGGSKSIPKKNIRYIAGKPLCAWVLEAACQSGVFDKVIVSTDSAEITNVVSQLDLCVEILRRPDELATDTASTESVMTHAAAIVDFDVLVTLQATSPMVTPDDIRRAARLFSSGDYDSLLTAVRTKRFFWDDNAQALNYAPDCRPRRQDFSGSLMENGAFYFTRRSLLDQTGCRLGGKIGIYEMEQDAGVEIDEPDDWAAVEIQLREKATRDLQGLLDQIKMLVVDVDGTLTDAGMYWSAEGDLLKKFNTRDAKGLELVRQSGVDVAIMTSENSPIVKARAAKLDIDLCFINVQDKPRCLFDLIADQGVQLTEVGYIGDDVNDLECLSMAGFSACPADAVERVTKVVNYVSKACGGQGAVRDVCDLICKFKELRRGDIKVL